jgi:gliding motility-associated-like protein
MTGLSQDKSGIRFIENKGQLPSKVDFKLSLNAGDIYLEGNKTTFSVYDKSQYADYKHGKTTDSIIEGHNYSIHWIGASETPNITAEDPGKNYTNYFLGNDPSKWASNVRDYEGVWYENLYDHIDLHYYGFYNQLKYDLVVHPYGDVTNIQIKYNDVNDLKIQKGNLVIETNAGKIVEQSPYAYQMVDGVETKVACRYALDGNILSFILPNGYDEDLTLIIDPILTFSTFTGSTASNFGCTATYDNSGNMYVGGTVFGVGYPLTAGAFQVTPSGGSIDMGISKFSSDGTLLLYSTYIGGTDNEIPHSLVVNSADELCILGTTGSADYPTTPGAFDLVFNGGPVLNLGGGYGFNYNFGCDLVITQLSANGTALIGSTFMGGTDSDGINIGSLLHYNYGDAFRGEIIVDLADNIIVASTTHSSDFPVSATAVQPVFGGLTDACLFSFNNGLTALNFSTYAGGSDYDSGFSTQIDSNGDIYITGGTISTDLTTTLGALNPSYMGGTTDGFLTHYNTNASLLVASTYIGTSGYDQSFFVQIDTNDDVYIVGQTDGPYPVLFTGTVGYVNPNSGQFIHKLTPDLSTTLLSTTVGTSSGAVDISITAFLITDCNFIYFTGWGGPLNGNTSINAHATQSTTVGFPLTSDAYQSTTDGSDFYIAVLSPDAQTLLYGSYFGGAVSGEHADGGTSRFDKNGNMYQAVCAGCGGNSDFPTTPGVWSNTNNSTNCNLGAFKFDLSVILPSISIPTPYVCIPNSYQFFNSSNGGNVFHWDFGDGDTSNLFEPSHLYSDTGNYDVTLIVSDSLGCLTPDTAVINVDVYAVDNAVIQPIDTLCPGQSVQLSASGGSQYEWFPSTDLSDPFIYNPIASPSVNTTYKVVVRDSCGVDSTYVTIFVYNETTLIMPDTLICIGNSIDLVAYGGVSYNWYPTAGMVNPGADSPTITPSSSNLYYVDITTANGCVYTDSVLVTVDASAPAPSLNADTTICYLDQILLSASGGQTYSWYPNASVVNLTGSNTVTNITNSQMIYVDVTNGCGTKTDSIYITVVEVIPTINPDTIICPGDTALLYADGGTSYLWTPAETVFQPNDQQTGAVPVTSTTYAVTVTNSIGCSSNTTTNVSLYLLPEVNAGGFINALYGSQVQLNGTTNATTFVWSSADTLSCTNCLNPVVIPFENESYVLTVEDLNGCINSDTVLVTIDGTLYVPNAFTPNGDGFNDIFDIKGEEISSFQLRVFDRWGLLIFESNSLNNQWDGSYNGQPVQMDVYVWKVEYTDYQRNSEKRMGHVSVVK